jgi:hypothetical protein
MAARAFAAQSAEATATAVIPKIGRPMNRMNLTFPLDH